MLTFTQYLKRNANKIHDTLMNVGHMSSPLSDADVLTKTTMYVTFASCLHEWYRHGKGIINKPFIYEEPIHHQIRVHYFRYLETRK